MSRSFKHKNNTYLDSEGIVHNRNLLSTILDTKTIYDSNSNVNGNYIRYNDGTMICTKQCTGSAKITYSWGALYDTGESQILDMGNYAQVFKTPPILSLNFTGANGCWLEGVNNKTASHICNIVLASATSKTVGFTIDIIAIGKWK